MLKIGVEAVGKRDIIIVSVLMVASILVLVVPIVVSLIRRFTKSSKLTGKKGYANNMFVFSACLVVSVWCLRYAVGYYSIIIANDITLTWWEEIFNSMVHALQTFSMDEEYTEYILYGKKMICFMFGQDTIWSNVYGVYVSILNIVAPIAGGAVIFEILASIFPKLKVQLSNLLYWREKYYFSELNSASLSLASSILIAFNNTKKPLIIFTDTYVDDEEEKGSELFLEAKRIGAICVRDDLSQIKKSRFGKRKFFLIDEIESNNLQSLAKLANSDNCACLKNSEIYFFTNDDAYVQLEKMLRNKLLEEESIKEHELPVFIPVLCYRNMISNLLEDIPLYEPIVGKNRNADGTQDLTVTIIGTGSIGTEMFLSAYWFGQILDCNLKINILSQETEEEFWNKIDYVNPEIKHTTIEDDPILRINKKGDMAKVYCEVEYIQCDVRSSRFVECIRNPESHILNTDYYFVSLGSDENNISVANTIRKYIGEHHINIGLSLKTVITYVVYDTDLSNILNQKKYFNYVDDKVDIYMRAVGSLNDVYSIENVFMTHHESFVKKIQASYELIQNNKGRAEKYEERIKDDYKYWANLARKMHIKYKIYSAGLIKKSLFDYPDAEKELNNEMKKNYRLYQEFASCKINDDKNELASLDRMAWLEHRRWNAFTRIKGFRCTRQYDVYAKVGENGSYKQMDIKLHPCLLECDQKGIRKNFNPDGDTLLASVDQTDFDLLDELSYDLHNKSYNGYDFKKYDYSICD